MPAGGVRPSVRPKKGQNVKRVAKGYTKKLDRKSKEIERTQWWEKIKVDKKKQKKEKEEKIVIR